jgi:hypothetical protein
MARTQFSAESSHPSPTKRYSDQTTRAQQGCQMVYLYTKNDNFNAFLKSLGWKNFGMFHGLLVYCIGISPFGIFVENFSRFGLLY